VLPVLQRCSAGFFVFSSCFDKAKLRNKSFVCVYIIYFLNFNVFFNSLMINDINAEGIEKVYICIILVYFVDVYKKK
jgi:hypothetical protein